METCFNLGYGGWCAITQPKSINYEYKSAPQSLSGDLIMFQVLSARVSKNFSVPTINSFYLPKSDFSNSVKSSIRLGYGTCSFQGEISFEVTNSTLKLLTNNQNGNYGNMFKQDALFHVQFFDGKNTCTIYNCAWNNFSINCQPGALVTGSLSFQSNNGYQENLLISNQDLNNSYQFNESDLLIPYWQTGSDNMIQFQLSFNKTITPIYLNNCFVTPSYLRQGLIGINLSATYFDEQQNNIGDNLSIKIGTKKISFNSLVLQNHGYEMSNLQSQGEKTYQWNTIALAQKNPVFIIVDNTID